MLQYGYKKAISSPFQILYTFIFIFEHLIKLPFL